MRNKLALIILLALLAPPLIAQVRRGMTPEDTLRVAEVSDAQMSPGGEWVVYVVVTTEGNERRSTLWLARTISATVSSVPGFIEDPRDISQNPLAPVRLNTAGLNASRPRWSPDGKRLAFFGSGRGQTAGLWLLSSFERQSQPRLVAAVRDTNHHIPYAGEAFAWSPDGRRIAFISATEDDDADVQHASVDAQATDAKDDPRVVERIQYKSRTSFTDRLRTHVWLVETDEPNAQPRQLTDGPFYDHALTWSPRGDELAFLSNREPDPDAFNNSDIFAVTTDGRTRRITETKGCEYEPQWSPDGRFIAYTATTRDVTTIDSVSEDTHVWVVEPSGGGRREISGTLDRRARSLRWSHESRGVFFLAGDQGRTNLYMAFVGGSQVVEILGPSLKNDESCRMTTPVVPPLQVTGFSVGARQRDLIALTISTPAHPAEVWLFKRPPCFRLARLSGHNDMLTRTLALSAPEEFTFRSFDGTQVQGWLMRPVGFRASSSQRHPLVLSIHGGPHGMYGYGFSAEFQAYAARGYAVALINPRGSTGYGQKFSDGTFREWGGGNYRDLMAGVDEILGKHSWIDAERLGVVGGSYGGFMVNWIVTQTTRFRAAVARASVSNLVSFYGTSLYQDLIHAEFGGFPWDDYDLLWRWSPLRYVERARTPTLFIHGEQDNDVPITQAEEMYMALRRRGVETQLARYPREGHGFREPRHRQDALERTLDWFDKYLK